MNINLKQDSIVVFVGTIGTGKTTFANNKFAKHNVVETDFIREQLTGNFESQDYNDATFEILYATITARAKAGLFTVVDSTGSRTMIETIKNIGKQHNRPLYIIKFPFLKEEEITKERMQHRMKYLHVYYNMKTRIEKTIFPKEYIIYELDDINDVKISFEKYQDEYHLDSNYSYVIIPDLHAEHHILSHYIEKYQNDENVRFISLGDIVDRGDSSYHTFLLVKKMIDKGKLFSVISNHDNKVYRYFKKWLMDDKQKFDKNYHYGMILGHGMQETIQEFYSLHSSNMHRYAEDFIQYYNSAKPYLFMEKNNDVHYFAHAGISYNIATGQKLGKSDISSVLYETIQDPEVLSEMFKNESKNVFLHVGHEYKSDTINIIHDKTDRRLIVKHDIGIGKRKVFDIPDFMVIE